MPIAQATTSINFDTELQKIGSWTILRLPKDASAQLPSRGQVMVEGSINGVHIKTPLEPDGLFSHWLKIDKSLQDSLDAKAGDKVSASIQSIKDWPEPEVPTDIKLGLANHPETKDMWQQITPMARWEWIRWIRSTSKSETRSKRIEVARSKMKSGERRPCCWNRNLCTEPEVSKGGVLLSPSTHQL